MNGFHPGMADLLIALRGATAGRGVARTFSVLRAAQKLAHHDQPDLDAITGGGPALNAARAMVADLQLWRAGQLTWSELTRTALFSSSTPGTGKSWLAQASAHARRALPPSLPVSANGRRRAIWAICSRPCARVLPRPAAAPPAMLILDELDAVGTRTGNAARIRITVSWSSTPSSH